jgi:DNA polymerase-3 subunit beta
MEFSARQPDLLRELEVLQGVVERKNTVPILGNVLLSADKEGLELTATDLEVSVRSRTAADVKQEGAVSVSARKLYEIVRLLPDSEIKVRDDADHWVSVVCDRSRFRIMGLGKDDFPALPAADKASKVRIPGALFRKMVEKVIFAVTMDDARFALNGALLVLKGDAMTLVASDGARLACVTTALEAKSGSEDERVLIPRKALSEIARMASGAEEEIYYCRRESHLFFDIGRRHLSSRVLEGTFPNFEKVIPSGNDKLVEFDRVELTTALTRVSVLANERSRAIRLSLKGGKAEVFSRNPEMGDASESLSVEYAGSDMEVGFNAKYLLDFLSVAEGEKVTFELKDEVTQGLLRPSGDEGKRYTYVVMPMRI